MRYLINGVSIRTENAAKSSSQKSSAVDAYLLSLKGKPSVLDFGCGKLRYADTLASVASDVTFVDSSVQIGREQLVRCEKTTVKEYVQENYRGCSIVCFEDLAEHEQKYDVVTCTNVLSAIPCKKTLSEVLAQIHRLLKRDGVAVFVNQHRSSYFKKYESGKKLLYGFLHSGPKGASYYGILDRAVIEELLTEHGYGGIRSWCVGESTFAEATSNS
ncbi:MAG: class I SAM-dependent methyltransferase [Halomonas sp.]|uniref:class I SAM-dependent methyltransferase n=1 Tax=Halomonas TaxID=2745 RepID=UPI00186913AF